MATARAPATSTGQAQSRGTRHQDTIHWDTIHWDTIHWDTMHEEAMHEDTMNRTAARNTARISDTERALIGRLGQHLLCAAFGCDPGLTRDAGRLGSMLEALCRRHGLTVLERFTHAYEPYGLTVGLVIGESHLILHTWPEHDLVHVDLFSCVPVDRGALLEDLGLQLRADRIGLLYDSTCPEGTR